jgi:hypothetical protein
VQKTPAAEAEPAPASIGVPVSYCFTSSYADAYDVYHTVDFGCPPISWPDTQQLSWQDTASYMALPDPPNSLVSYSITVVQQNGMRSAPSPWTWQ